MVFENFKSSGIAGWMMVVGMVLSSVFIGYIAGWSNGHGSIDGIHITTSDGYNKSIIATAKDVRVFAEYETSIALNKQKLTLQDECINTNRKEFETWENLNYKCLTGWKNTANKYSECVADLNESYYRC
jgi:hypothetical protein